ncbi:MAG: hypothetical protein J1G38_07475 [Clostridiales bacterium]|nr:hypothetical protein [Clostridiales bacterium]
MEDTDDKKAKSNGKSKGDKYSLTVHRDTDDGVRNEPDSVEVQSDKPMSFAGELVALSVKAVAVALSLVVLIVSILVVAMPLSAMRVFNNLGMYERALNSGDRYIESRLDDAKANKTNDKGEYNLVRYRTALSDADMLEALDVCIDLSDDLMKKYVGKDQKSAAYFADRLDKYIRIYMSLNGEPTISSDKSKEMLDAMPPAYHPFVYDYRHTLMTMDYAARVYSGDAEKLNMMIVNTNGSGEYLMSPSDQSHNLYAISVDDMPWNVQMSRLDWFVDYLDQLNTYLAIQEERLGVTGTLTGVSAMDKFSHVLKGDEFTVLVTPTPKGNRNTPFTDVYDYLMGTSELYYDDNMSTRREGLIFKYVQLAYHFDIRGNTDYKLKRLHWLSVMVSAVNRLWNMQMLLFHSREAYGAYSTKISNEYYSDAFKYARSVIVGYDSDEKPVYRELSAIYEEEMSDYLRLFQNA